MFLDKDIFGCRSNFPEASLFLEFVWFVNKKCIVEKREKEKEKNIN